jgi:hypothetical protein
MLNTRVLSFRVFTDENGVYIIIWCLVPGNGDAWPNVGKKVKSPSESQIEGNMTLSDCPQQSAYKPLRPRMGLTRCGQRTFGFNIRNDYNSAQYIRAPLRATVFFLIELTAASGMTVLPPFRTGVTSTSSHWIGT